MISQKCHKNLIFRALRKLNVWEDAEDAVQNAYYLLYKYKDRLDISNPERLMTWFTDQECTRIWKRKNGITGKGAVGPKIRSYSDTCVMDMSPEEEISIRGEFLGYNEGEYSYDMKLLKAAKNPVAARGAYENKPYAETVFMLGECYSRTKYGTYARVKLSTYNPYKYREVRCYKLKA